MRTLKLADDGHTSSLAWPRATHSATVPPPSKRFDINCMVKLTLLYTCRTELVQYSSVNPIDQWESTWTPKKPGI
jgi:hypothetical protein